MKVNKVHVVLAALLLSLSCSSFIEAAAAGSGGGGKKRGLEGAASGSGRRVASRTEGGAGGVSDDNRETPLHIAARDGNIGAVQALLAAAPNLHAKKALILEGNNLGETAKNLAIMNGNFDIATMLNNEIAHIDADLITLVDVYTATLHGNYKFVKEKLDAMDETRDVVFVNTLIKQATYRCPLLHLAVYSRNVDLVEELLISGALVNAPDANSSTALHFASFLGNKAIVTKLLNTGADINATNSSGKTAYDVAVARGNAEIALLILAEPERRLAQAAARVILPIALG